MASSSPASFKSQAHEASEDLRSQVPFHTQLPYDRSPLEVSNQQHLPSVAKSASRHRPRSRETSTETPDLQPSISKGNELVETDSPSAQRWHQSQPTRDGTSGKVQPSTVFGAVRLECEDEAASSDESIECEPLGTISGRVSARSHIEEYASDIPKSGRQPFPLVEWIRRIREESKPEWPTLPLKWSRSISKRQRAILDADDAWYPPLPGRPNRQGTIPIDILTTLTHQADLDAKRKHDNELQNSERDPSRGSGRRTHVSQPQNWPSSLPSPASIRDSDVPWSSSPPSPPRRLLPPDTSPPRPSSYQGRNLATADDTLLGANQSIPTNSKGGFSTHISPNSSDHVEQIQNHFSPRPQKGTEDESRGGPSGIVEVSTLPQEKLTTSPPRESPPVSSLERSTRLPKTNPRSGRRVQVKDTPYPFKGLPQDRARRRANDYLPQSSLVAGTYPDAANPDRRSDNSPTHESSPVFQSSIARVNIPQPDTQSSSAKSQGREQSLKRKFDEVNQQAHTAVKGSAFPRDHSKSSESNIDKDRQLERQFDESDTRPARKQSRNAATLSPSSSEYKAEEEVRVRNKERLIVKGIESRRGFRAPRSTSIMIDGVKFLPLQASGTTSRNSDTRTIGGIVFVPTSKPQKVDEGIKAISAAPSSPKSHGPTLAGSHSDGDNTSATNLSLHETSCPTKPPSRAVSRQTSVHTTVHTGGLGELFQSFIRAYPNYLGSLKNFESALRFLLNLRSKPREPHPSLWDDFVFRMADDYKVYLQECIDEAESALPYQDFYHTLVKQSERRSGIITEEGLKIATSSTMKPSTPLQRSSSNLLDHDDVIMVDAHTPNTEPSRSHATQSNVDAVQRLQSSQNRTLPATTGPVSVLQRPYQVRPIEPSTERGNTDRVIKRRSMPWSSERPLPDKTTLQTQQLERLTPSGKHISVTKVVEQWLNRPAGARSPEIELTQIQSHGQEIAAAPLFNADLPKTTRKTVADSFFLQDTDLSRLSLPGYLTTPKDPPVKDTNNKSPDPLPSITASDIASQAERPVTPFTLFTRDFANLQSEKGFRSLPTNKRKIPINIYEW